jgi:hypothetical protein
MHIHLLEVVLESGRIDTDTSPRLEQKTHGTDPRARAKVEPPCYPSLLRARLHGSRTR